MTIINKVVINLILFLLEYHIKLDSKNNNAGIKWVSVEDEEEKHISTVQKILKRRLKILKSK